jgi:hypothetical protein
MAFGVQAIYSGGTVSLTDSSPYSLLSARGMAGAPVRRVTSRGPNQEGDTDLGYRLKPREVELQLGFVATTDAILDGYRDTLMTVFKPLSSTPVYLRVTRDDGEVRQLDCYTVGGVDIQWIKEHRPSHYHVATVRLYAPDSAYYDTTPGTVTATGATSGTAADWYLAGGAIGTASVLMSGGTPTQGLAWTYAGSIAHTTSYTLAFRTTKETHGTADKYAFYVDNNDLVGEMDITMRATGTALPGDPLNYYASTVYPDTTLALGTTFMSTGTANYFLRHDSGGITTGGLPTANTDMYIRQAAAGTLSIGLIPGVSRPIGGATRRWRSDGANTAASRWAGTVLLYALYSPGLTEGQINTLSGYMDGAIGGTAFLTASVQYLGDLPEYPIISIRGPITGLIMTNTATGDSIALGTTAIASGETYVFDLRPGYKTVTLGTVNKRSTLADYSDWDEWHLAPDPVGVQGANPIYIYGTNTSGSTQITIVYYERYSSF